MDYVSGRLFTLKRLTASVHPVTVGPEVGVAEGRKVGDAEGEGGEGGVGVGSKDELSKMNRLQYASASP